MGGPTTAGTPMEGLVGFGKSQTGGSNFLKDIGTGVSNFLMGEKEKGYGAYKGAKQAAAGYLTAPGTRMGVDTQLGGLRDDAGWGQGMAQFNDLGQMMMARARGEAPSIAELQMRRGLSDAMRAQQSFAAGATGANRAAMNRMAMTNMAGLQSQGIEAAAMLRAQEQAQAEDALRQALAQQMGLGLQREMGLGLGIENIAASNLAASLGAKRGQSPGLLGNVVGAAGDVLASFVGKED